MKRVHILVHTATHLATSQDYTTIMGAYSTAEKVRKAYEKIIDETTKESMNKGTFVKGYEELIGCYRLETKNTIHYFYIKVKELQ